LLDIFAWSSIFNPKFQSAIKHLKSQIGLRALARAVLLYVRSLHFLLRMLFGLLQLYGLQIVQFFILSLCG
jgi:hypothetical protein